MIIDFIARISQQKGGAFECHVQIGSTLLPQNYPIVSHSEASYQLKHVWAFDQVTAEA